MPFLIIQNAVDAPPPIDLSVTEEVSVGRADGNVIVLNDNRVSRKHALFFQVNGLFFVKDCGSKFGTSVNGESLSGPTELSPGDTITCGDTQILFSDTADRPAPPRPAAPPPPSPEQPQENTEVRRNNALYCDELMRLKKKMHQSILEKMNLNDIAMDDIENEDMRERVEGELEKTLREFRHEIPARVTIESLRQNMLDELLAFGPITPLLRDPSVDEVMINGPSSIFVESKGRLFSTGAKFFNDQHLVTIIQRIVEPLGRHVSESSPMVDARLPDGSRVNAIIPPLALDGASVTIRKFSTKKLTTEDLIKFGSMTPEIALFLEEAIRARQNIVVSGGTGSGKTTLLNVLSQFIPLDERVVTIEDSAELKLDHSNMVRLEARPANIEGKGRITIRDLVINALRMRPDRIIVGECRGGEALDMLQAMNTGHDGSLTTVHANNPRDALRRLENMVMMAGYDLPAKAIREQISSAVNIVIQQTRLTDGSRKIITISELSGSCEGDQVLMQDIFNFQQDGYDERGMIVGRYAATGNIPQFVDLLDRKGDLRLNRKVFVPQN